LESSTNSDSNSNSVPTTPLPTTDLQQEQKQQEPKEETTHGTKLELSPSEASTTMSPTKDTEKESMIKNDSKSESTETTTTTTTTTTTPPKSMKNSKEGHDVRRNESSQKLAKLPSNLTMGANQKGTVQAKRKQHLTLGQVIADKELLNDFRQFLAEEWSGENLVFYEAILKFRQQTVDQSPEELYKQALEIESTFLSDSSPCQVNVSATIYKGIRAALSQKQPIHPSIVNKTVFDEARIEVLQLLESDSYFRWKRIWKQKTAATMRK